MMNPAMWECRLSEVVQQWLGKTSRRCGEHVSKYVKTIQVGYETWPRVPVSKSLQIFFKRKNQRKVVIQHYPMIHKMDDIAVFFWLLQIARLLQTSEVLEECSCKTGWLPQKTLDAIRERMAVKASAGRLMIWQICCLLYNYYDYVTYILQYRCYVRVTGRYEGFFIE